jgi:hypothetical protein
MRRRLRYLRTVRELSYRDLGGLMFDLHRFGGRRDELLVAKLTRLSELDRELRAIENALDEHQPVTVLREAGVLACLRCAAIHSSDDKFCPHCGMSVSRDAERPLSTAPEAPSAQSSPPGAGAPPGPVPAAAPPAAAKPGATTPSQSPPASPQPAAPTPVPRQRPVPGRVSGAPSDPQATGLMAPAPARSDRAAGGDHLPDGQVSGGEGAAGAAAAASDSSAPEGEAVKDAQTAIDQPTRVLRRSEPPEGSKSE